MLFVLPLKPDVKVSVMNRVIAKVIDLILVMAVASIPIWPLAPILAFLYSIFGDGMNFGPFRGQSVGKRLIGLQVVHLIRKQPANFRDSMFRNLPVGVATFFSIIPLWGWLILPLIGIPLMAMEIYLMISVGTGHRLGDVMGDTEVVDWKPEPKAKI